MPKRTIKPPPPKRHHSERYSFPGGLKERWTRKQAALAGFLHASPHSSRDLPEALGPGIHDATVRAMLRRRWELPAVPKGVVVKVSRDHIPDLEKQAAARGLTVERYLARICLNAIRDDLYNAIVPKGQE